MNIIWLGAAFLLGWAMTLLQLRLRRRLRSPREMRVIRRYGADSNDGFLRVVDPELQSFYRPYVG